MSFLDVWIKVTSLLSFATFNKKTVNEPFLVNYIINWGAKNYIKKAPNL
jgi:hypothetical protein